MDYGPDCLATPSSWGEGGGGCSTRIFGHVPKAFPFLRAPSCYLLPTEASLPAALISPRVFSLSARPSCLLVLLQRGPRAAKAPLPSNLPFTPVPVLRPKEISPGGSCRSSPLPPRGEPRAGVTHARPPPQGSAALLPPPVQPQPQRRRRGGWGCALVGYSPHKVGDQPPTSPTGPVVFFVWEPPELEEDQDMEAGDGTSLLELQQHRGRF